MTAAEAESPESDLIDLDGLDLRELSNFQHPALGRVLRRILAGAADPHGASAGFQSAIQAALDIG